MQLPHKLQISYYQIHKKVTTDSFLGACDTSLKIRHFINFRVHYIILFPSTSFSSLIAPLF